MSSARQRRLDLLLPSRKRYARAVAKDSVTKPVQPNQKAGGFATSIEPVSVSTRPVKRQRAISEFYSQSLPSAASEAERDEDADSEERAATSQTSQSLTLPAEPSTPTDATGRSISAAPSTPVSTTSTLTDIHSIPAPSPSPSLSPAIASLLALPPPSALAASRQSLIQQIAATFDTAPPESKLVSVKLSLYSAALPPVPRLLPLASATAAETEEKKPVTPMKSQTTSRARKLLKSPPQLTINVNRTRGLMSALALPVSYSLLLNIFHGLECALCVRSQRSAQWSNLKQSVELIVGRTVDRTHLLQILYLFPEAFDMREVESKNDWGQRSIDIQISRKSLADRCVPVTPRTPQSSVPSPPLSTGGDSGHAMRERKQEFESRLLAFAVEQHQAFLTQRQADDWDVQSQGFHREFQTSLTDIPMAKIGDSSGGSGGVSARSVSTMLSLLTRKESVPEPNTPVTPTEHTESQTPSTPSTPFTDRSSFLANYRRRAAEQKLAQADEPTPLQLQRLEHLGKLPVLLDTVVFAVKSSGKALLPETELLSQCESSATGQFRNRRNLELQLALLQSFVPEALLVRVMGSAIGNNERKMIGLAKNLNVEAMKAKLRQEKEREESEMRAERELERRRLEREARGCDEVRNPSPAKRSLLATLNQTPTQTELERQQSSQQLTFVSHQSVQRSLPFTPSSIKSNSALNWRRVYR